MYRKSEAGTGEGERHTQQVNLTILAQALNRPAGARESRRQIRTSLCVRESRIITLTAVEDAFLRGNRLRGCCLEALGTDFYGDGAAITIARSAAAGRSLGGGCGGCAGRS